MEFHFTVPELKTLTKVIERDLKTAETNETPAEEVITLEQLKIRFERKLNEYEYQQQHKNL